MYEYVDYTPLNEAEILKRVSQEEIIEMALGYKPVPYQKIVSPFRKNDRRPGAYFEWYNNKLFYLDFADNPTHRIFPRFLMDFYGISFFETLKLINQHFSLGLGENSGIPIPKPVVYDGLTKLNTPDKQRTFILYNPRTFNTRDREFWSPMYITRDQLIEDSVYAVIWYKFFSKATNDWVVIRPQDITYAFTEFNQRVKIYRPMMPRGSKKWITNCSENDVGAINKLPVTGKNLIVTKAYKDCRVIRNEGIPSIWFQNEGCVPSDEIIIDLCERFDFIYLFYDNDEAGIKAALKLCSIFNAFYPGKALPLHLPTQLLKDKVKDPTDLIIKNKSLKVFQEFLKEKDLYGTNTSNYP